MTANWPQLEYHEVQNRLWTCPKRFVYVPAGRASGKTELSLRRLVRHLPVRKAWSDPAYIYAGPTYNQVKRIAWRKLLKLIPNRWILDASRSDLIITTIFGSTLSLIGLDKPERIEGIQIDGIVVDENCDIKPGTFDLSVLPTLTWRKGWAWRIGVPKRFGPGANEFRTRYEAALAGDLPDSAGFTWPSSEIVPADLLDHARATMDVRDFQEQFEASWLSASGGVFAAFNREFNVRPCQYDRNLPIIVGSDFNVDPMHWLLCHVKDDKLLVFDELFLRNSNTPEALKVLLTRYSGHKGGFQMYGDASSRGRHTSAYETDYNHISNNSQLRAYGLTMHYLRGNPPIADRFAVTNARLCDGSDQRHIFIDARCTHLIADLEIRSYKANTRIPADSGDIGHGSDALGYICFRRWPLRLQLPAKQGKVIITTGAY